MAAAVAFLLAQLLPSRQLAKHEAVLRCLRPPSELRCMAMPAALLLQQLLLLSQHADTGHRPGKPALGFNHCSIDCCSPDMPSARFMQARPPSTSSACACRPSRSRLTRRPLARRRPPRTRWCGAG